MRTAPTPSQATSSPRSNASFRQRLLALTLVVGACEPKEPPPPTPAPVAAQPNPKATSEVEVHHPAEDEEQALMGNAGKPVKITPPPSPKKAPITESDKDLLAKAGKIMGDKLGERWKEFKKTAAPLQDPCHNKPHPARKIVPYKTGWQCFGSKCNSYLFSEYESMPERAEMQLCPDGKTPLRRRLAISAESSIYSLVLACRSSELKGWVMGHAYDIKVTQQIVNRSRYNHYAYSPSGRTSRYRKKDLCYCEGNGDTEECGYLMPPPGSMSFNQPRNKFGW